MSCCRSVSLLVKRPSVTGLTRVELLVLLGVLFILAAIAYAPVSRYLADARLDRAIQNAHTLSILLSQYATDNNGVYPVGEGTATPGKSGGIARNLLDNNYTPNASIFATGTTPRYRGTAQDYSDLMPENISWDFTAGATRTTGITSAASDLLPIVYTTGQTVTYPTTAGAGSSVTLSSDSPYGLAGMIVAYKNNTAKFIVATPFGSTAVCQGFISSDFKDSAKYSQIKP